jgi:hypothetical protein
VAQDNATPSGNGIAAQALQRLAMLTGDTKYAAAAERCLKLYMPALEQAGSYHSSLCSALAEYLQPPQLLVLCGPQPDVAVWRDGLRSHYLPDVMIFALAEDMPELPQTLNKPVTAQATAWLCQGTQCLPPLAEWEALQATLQLR